MACDENIVVLVYLAVAVDVCPALLVGGKCARIEIMALNKQVIILINFAVGVYVAKL